MRIFYEEWRSLDINSSVATDELGEPKNNIQLQINQSLKIPEMKDFPIEDFFKVPFTHHSCILAGTKDLNARYYYIHRVAEEHLSVQALKKLIQKQAYTTEGKIPNWGGDGMAIVNAVVGVVTRFFSQYQKTQNIYQN